jgi:hypothetical protein
VKAYVWTFVALAGLSCALTLLFLGMRAVMEIGGACADGGPYVSAQPCPDGVPVLMIAGVWGGLVFAGVLAWQLAKLHPAYVTLVGWAWVALFVSLGWNFLEYGLDPPGAEDGPVIGWLVCGVLFVLMGGLPAIGLASPKMLRATFWPPDRSASPERRPAVGDFVPLGAGLRMAKPKPAPSAPDDVAGQLERLARLHRRGDLTDPEYEAAKRAVLGG